MAKSSEHQVNLNSRLLIIGTLLFILYYLADCALDSLVFGKASFIEQLHSPSAHEVAIRCLSGFFLFTLYIASSRLLNKNKNLQNKLLLQSKELLANNRELEAYHYALSHELRTSLTRVMTAKEMLVEACPDCNDNQGKQLLEHIHLGCEKMSQQIDGMLNLSEINRYKLEQKSVAIDNIARDIATELTSNIKNTVLDFQIDSNLETRCDPELIRIALKNLIDNAIKYRDPERPSEISIGMMKKNDVPVYYIRDNGIGFDLNDQERLFRPFERLPETRCIPGNGVGLATASTIIERHGGKIWAEGTPDRGATFYFTL